MFPSKQNNKNRPYPPCYSNESRGGIIYHPGEFKNKKGDGDKNAFDDINASSKYRDPTRKSETKETLYARGSCSSVKKTRL